MADPACLADGAATLAAGVDHGQPGRVVCCAGCDMASPPMLGAPVHLGLQHCPDKARASSNQRSTESEMPILTPRMVAGALLFLALGPVVAGCQTYTDQYGRTHNVIAVGQGQPGGTANPAAGGLILLERSTDRSILRELEKAMKKELAEAREMSAAVPGGRSVPVEGVLYALPDGRRLLVGIIMVGCGQVGCPVNIYLSQGKIWKPAGVTVTVADLYVVANSGSPPDLVFDGRTGPFRMHFNPKTQEYRG